MSIIIAGVVVFAFSIIVLSFINLQLSVAVYISYLILVPYLEFRFAGLSLSYNLVNTLLFIVFLYQSIVNKRYKINYQVITPFLFLYFTLLFLTFFATGMPWGDQFNGWRASFMQTCLISFIVWNLALSEQKFLGYFKWAFIISISIAGVYGLYLMKLEGLNPYTSILSDYFGKDDMALRFSKMEGRLDFSSASKIQSTMAHPMTWTLVLCFSIITLFVIYSRTKNEKIWFLFGILVFNIFISGVRTGMAAIAIGFLYFLIRNRNIKLILVTLIAFGMLVIVIKSNDSLSNLFASFTDVSGQKSDVSGSSIEMRLDQLQGSINEIKGNELVGKGYGWTGFYMSIYEIHPVILAFESLIFMVLCNSGYIGLLVWILFFLLLFNVNRKILKLRSDIFLMDSYIIIYAAYATGTGEYNYMPFFAFFYSFLLGYLNSTLQTKNSIKKNWESRDDNKYIKFEIKN